MYDSLQKYKLKIENRTMVFKLHGREILKILLMTILFYQEPEIYCE